MNEFRLGNALGLNFKSWFKNFIPFTLIAAVIYAAPIIWVDAMAGIRSRKRCAVRPTMNAPTR